jgi:hypothetical protein
LAFASVAGVGRANLTIWGGDLTEDVIPVSRDTGEQSSFVVGFTVGPSGHVALAFSGHLASEIFYGEGLGASAISGAPIHHRWIDDNGSSPGNRELPLQQGSVRDPILVYGTKYLDADGDGDVSEEAVGLGGWTVRAFNGAPVQAAVTISEGDWVPDGFDVDVGDYLMALRPGSFTLCEALTDAAGGTEWTQTYPSGGSAAACTGFGEGLGAGGHTLDLVEGIAPVEGADFGNFGWGEVTVCKAELRGMGYAPGEGWTMRVTPGAFPAVSSGGVTGADGCVTLDVKAGGELLISEVPQAGWVQDYPGPDSDHVFAVPAGSVRSGVDLGGGYDPSGAPFTFKNSAGAVVEGVKFHDLNGDGVRDEEEPGLDGWTICAYPSGGGEPTCTTTRAGDEGQGIAPGSYALSVAPGTYDVREICPEGWYQSFPADGGSACNQGHDGLVLLGGLENAASGMDFGNYRHAAFSGMKFEDANGNGAFDGEPGLDGWQIRFFGTTGLGQPVDLTLTTSNGGLFSTSVAPGAYTVCEVQQSGWTQTYPATGVDCASLEATFGHVGYGPTLESQDESRDNRFGNAGEGEVDDCLGCTPGYWKQAQHFGNWAAPYSPVATEDPSDVETVGGMFTSAPAAFAGASLVEGLGYRGGPGLDGATQILIRAAIAGVLNLAHPGIRGHYEVTMDSDGDGHVDHTVADEASLVGAVNAALDSGDRDIMLALAGRIDDANNQDCPLGRSTLGS